MADFVVREGHIAALINVGIYLSITHSSQSVTNTRIYINSGTVRSPPHPTSRSNGFRIVRAGGRASRFHRFLRRSRNDSIRHLGTRIAQYSAPSGEDPRTAGGKRSFQIVSGRCYSSAMLSPSASLWIGAVYRCVNDPADQ